MTDRQKELIELINKEVKPALGCTEPIAVALAVSKAAETMREYVRDFTDYTIKVSVSGNILKNGMGVGIPGTGMVGLYIASALGAVCGRSSYGLEVLHDVDRASIDTAKAMVDAGKVSISVADTDHKLYAAASISCQGHEASAVVQNDHDRIVSVSFDGTEVPGYGRLSSDASTDQERTTLDYHLTVREIYDFACEVPYGDIKFILDSKKLNLALANEGLNGDYGLNVGRTIASSRHKACFGEDFLCYAMSLTAAASDARMAGCTLPAMSNSGSGNQGITATMPVIAYALKYSVCDEMLARALVLSHLVAIHIKGYLGKLSALCGCVIASTGSSCGITFLNGGGYEHICSAIKNMIGNITGMVCDGAKVGCAMKVASGVSSAVQSAILALDGECISENDGIIEKDIEKTIRNLGNIGSVGMQNADEMILKIMVCK